MLLNLGTKYEYREMGISECTEDWFQDLEDKRIELARNDIAHVFGIFRKADGKHGGE